MVKSKVDNALKILSRIRCLNECALSLNDGTAFPPALYYTPAETECRTTATINIPIYRHTKADTCHKLFRCTPTHRLHLSGIYEYNADGVWDKLIKITLNKTIVVRNDGTDQWILLWSFKKTGQALFTPVSLENDKSDFENDWKSFVDQSYLPKGVMTSKRCQFQASSDGLNLERFRQDLCNWTASHDEQLCGFLSERVGSHSPKTTSSDCVESFRAGGCRPELIFNDDWSSDSNSQWFSGHEPPHTIDFCLKKDVILESLTLHFLRGGENMYHPSEVEVSGGESGNLRVLRTVTIENEYVESVELLPRQHSYLQCIRLILKPKDRLDAVGIAGIEIKPIQNFYEARNFFETSAMSRYPMLQRFPPEMLYIRSVLLQRLVELFDSVLPYFFPKWEHTLGLTDLIQSLQVILPLSSKRVHLIEQVLDKTKKLFETPPALMINRIVQNSLNATDRTFKNSVFYQIFNELKHSNSDCVHYRFAKDLRQWWVCIFIGEGIIDQGGGFRDSLSNISEELCPNLESGQIPILNLFIPSPNQRNVTVHDLQDTFIPNPSCSDFQYYEWIGKLMGGALRTDDNLVLCLPMYFWKMLIGVQVTWEDYASVDEKEVDVINLMENMDEELFESYFVGTRTWTTILSDGTVVPLKPDGERMVVEYCDRLEYAKLAQVARMNEFKTQVDAIRTGLLQVVPGSVFQLLTLKDIEERICGKPEISFADLQKSITFYSDGIEEPKRKYLWAALKQFSNEDRSKFLRFVTGRRRLPVKIIVMNREGIDICPSATTCHGYFYLPDYSSAEVAEIKIRYAIYNCGTIETDTAIREA